MYKIASPEWECDPGSPSWNLACTECGEVEDRPWHIGTRGFSVYQAPEVVHEYQSLYLSPEELELRTRPDQEALDPDHLTTLRIIALSRIEDAPFDDDDLIEMFEAPGAPDPEFPMAVEYRAIIEQYEAKRDAHANEHGDPGEIMNNGLITYWSCCGEVEHVFGEEEPAA